MTSSINDTISSSEMEAKLWMMMDHIMDPEVPVISIRELGIVRDIKLISTNEGYEGTITITPTYSGCPAMDVIAMDIRLALITEGLKSIKVITSLSPAWTTDWMSEAGKQKLKAFGIAPPVGKSFDQQYLENQKVECPLCHSSNTRLVSQFGSTACKALFQCLECKETFDYFKCH